MADDFYKWFSERRLTRFGGARRLRIEHGRLALLSRYATPPGDLPEIGPGVGSLVEPLTAMGWTYRAVEASPALAAQIRARGVEVIEAWVPPFPVGDESCDVVYADQVLEHMSVIDAAHAFASEAHRVLRPGGVAFIVVPDYLKERTFFWDVDYTHNFITTERRVRQLGYWFSEPDPDYRPPADLLRFLEAGPPPVYFGLGSVVDRGAADLTRLVIRALAMTGKRGILLGGWSNLGAESLPPTLFRIESAPHDWLFPRMAAVAHHGGAGTTAAGLRAGMPSVIIPFFADQPFWGQRVAALGVGPAPVPRQKLTAERLAAALYAVTGNPQMRRRAVEVAEALRGEDGIGAAVAVVEQFTASRRRLAGS